MQPHSPPLPPAQHKSLIRQEIAAARRLQSGLAAAAFSERIRSFLRSIAAYHQAKVVLSYASIRGEVATNSIHHDVVGRRRRLFLPASDGEIQFRSWCPGDPTCVGPQGFWGPSGGEVFVAAEGGIVLVPVVAWDTAGRRLGRGAGFYDRFLAGIPDTLLRIGLAFDFQRHERLPSEAWDRRLDMVVSESGVHPCHGRNGCSPASTAEKEWHRS